MEPWFVKSVPATVSIVPAFIAIPFFKFWFVLSAGLATTYPALFKPVNTEFARVAGILLVLAGLYLLAGGRLPAALRNAA